MSYKIFSAHYAPGYDPHKVAADIRNALGQAKLVPGQIHFQTTRTGRIPSLQPLIEAGLPIAPYIEHGSYATGQPSIMRYGLDPYRGLGQVEPKRMPPVLAPARPQLSPPRLPSRRPTSMRMPVRRAPAGRAAPAAPVRGAKEPTSYTPARAPRQTQAVRSRYIAPSIKEPRFFHRIPSIKADGVSGDPSEIAQETIRRTLVATLSPAVMVGTGMFVGGAAGVAGGLLGRPLWGGLIGALGGGFLGYMAWKRFTMPVAEPTAPASPGLSGMLAVL